MAVTAIDLHVDDVPAATSLLSRAELDGGGLRIMLSREAMVPWGSTDGVILHHYVDNVAAAVLKAVEAGAELLAGPLRTDWGTEAAYLRGPGGLVVDVCRDVLPGPAARRPACGSGGVFHGFLGVGAAAGCGPLMPSGLWL